jgi:UDP-2-acetamido-3-amino-2,3-dideoxy-glucuronate N-acetyltransferase
MPPIASVSEKASLNFQFAFLPAYFRLSMTAFLPHPSAIIDPGATVGPGTCIWHFCHLMPGAVIGANCILGQNVFIDNNVVIGNGVKIQNNVSVYNGVTIEDDVFLGPSMVFTNVINPRSFIERKSEFKKTLVRKGATIGANATIVCGVEIGSFAMIGAGSVVTKDVLPFSLVYGNPARHRGWVSRHGLSLQFSGGEATCPESGERYLLIDNRVQLR